MAGASIGVKGFCTTVEGTPDMPAAGVLGESHNSIIAAVRGVNAAQNGLAGDFSGKVQITGDLTVTGSLRAGGNDVYAKITTIKHILNTLASVAFSALPAE